jgi:lauroyl/myristoyl acyltransferase
MPVSVRWTRERGYHTVSTPPMALERTGDRLQDVIHNARRVLSIIEGWVAERPDQWLMYYPVWPEQES